MTNKQPLPLKLADKMEAMQRWPAGDVTCLEVAAELRRLYEENQQWQEKCNTYIEIHDAVVKDNERLHEVNAELVERVKNIAECCDNVAQEAKVHLDAKQLARLVVKDCNAAIEAKLKEKNSG